MIPIHFKKAFAESAIAAIKAGKPIPSPAAGWSYGDMLSLAGILYASIYSHGPASLRHAGIPASALAKMHTEKKEAVEETLNTDIHDGIEFISTLAFQVMDNQYDENCASEVKAVVYTSDDKKGFLPVQGFKGHDDMK